MLARFLWCNVRLLFCFFSLPVAGCHHLPNTSWRSGGITLEPIDVQYPLTSACAIPLRTFVFVGDVPKRRSDVQV